MRFRYFLCRAPHFWNFNGPGAPAFFAKAEMGSVRFQQRKICWRLLPSAARVRPASAAAHNSPSVRCTPLAYANDLTPCRMALPLRLRGGRRTPLHYRVRGGRSLRLPTEPCVRVRTRLFMQGESIEKLQTNAPACGRIVFPVLSG